MAETWKSISDATTNTVKGVQEQIHEHPLLDSFLGASVAVVGAIAFRGKLSELGASLRPLFHDGEALAPAEREFLGLGTKTAHSAPRLFAPLLTDGSMQSADTEAALSPAHYRWLPTKGSSLPKVEAAHVPTQTELDHAALREMGVLFDPRHPALPYQHIRQLQKPADVVKFLDIWRRQGSGQVLPGLE